MLDPGMANMSKMAAQHQALNSALYERMILQELFIFEEREMRRKLKERLKQQEIQILTIKPNLIQSNEKSRQLQNLNSNVGLSCGDYSKINDFLKRSTEQAAFPYYLFDGNGDKHCHCKRHQLVFFSPKKDVLDMRRKISYRKEMLSLHSNWSDVMFSQLFFYIFTFFKFRIFQFPRILDPRVFLCVFKFFFFQGALFFFFRLHTSEFIFIFRKVV
jgi:hypothetical protein